MIRRMCGVRCVGWHVQWDVSGQSADVRVPPFLHITHPKNDYLVIIRLRPPLFSDMGIKWRLAAVITNGIEFKGKEKLAPANECLHLA